ncbi:hypothetical protein EV121DRAFT_290796 [Schizophyllum commune]
MSERLPQELKEHVLDCLDGATTVGRRALQACALVSSSLLPRSQTLLFHDITIRNPQDVRNLSKVPHRLQAQVHVLRVAASFHFERQHRSAPSPTPDITALAKLLMRLPAVYDLRIDNSHHAVYYVFLPIAMCRALLAKLPLLRSLTLNRWTVPTSILNHLGNIQELHLTDVRFSAGFMPKVRPREQATRTAKLVHFAFEVKERDSLLELSNTIARLGVGGSSTSSAGLRTPIDLTSLRSLRLQVAGVPKEQGLILDACKDTLEALEYGRTKSIVGASRAYPSVNFVTMPRLQTLAIRDVNPNEVSEREFLDKLIRSAPNMQRLILNVNPTLYPLHEQPLWAWLDAALTADDAALTGLRGLTLVIGPARGQPNHPSFYEGKREFLDNALRKVQARMPVQVKRYVAWQERPPLLELSS